MELCAVHRNQFNSVSHRLIKLKGCPHRHCLAYYESALEKGGGYTCLICNWGYMETEKLADFDESGTYEAIEALKRNEIDCERHPRTLGEYFCSQELKVFCENCKHGANCCEENKDVRSIIVHQLFLMQEKPQLPADLKVKLRNWDMHSTQSCYELLRSCLRQQRTMKLCSNHQTMQAEGIHRTALTLGCAKCVSVEADNYVAVDLVGTQEVTGLIQQYLRRVHCYVVPLPLLAKLLTISALEIDPLLDLAVEISQLPTSKEEPVPTTLNCPKCLSPVPHLIRLNCFGGCHGLCSQCSIVGLTGIQCPLDGNTFQSLAGTLVQSQEEAKCQGVQNSGVDSDMELPECLSTITERVKSWPHWKGTSLPASTITDTDIKVAQRFFGLYPPAKALHCDLPLAMDPWNVNQHLDQVEAFVFTVTHPLLLLGLTIGCPLNPATQMLVDQVEIRRGKSLLAPVTATPFRSSKKVSNAGLVADLRFDTAVPIDSNSPYTLSLKLRSRGRELLQVYKGNQVTARENFSSDGVDLWSFERPKEVLNGDNSISGPILRLFYKT